MAPPETMPVTESELRGLGHTCGGAESSEELGAGAIFGMLLVNADGGGEEHGEGEVRDAEGDGEVVLEEQEQETQKESDRKAVEGHDVEEAKAQEKVPGEENTEAEPQHEDHQKAQHEYQKEQVQTNNDGEESMEADGEGAKGTDSEDPDAQAHENDVREGAQ